MDPIERIAAEIVAREGGFVDDPDDPGGATKHGVTLGTLRRLGRDLDGDGAVTVEDLRRLSPAEATRIFIEHYFRRPRLDRLPSALQPSVFDMQVNAGAMAVRLLQRLLVRLGLPVTVDGMVGPQTAAAATRAERLAGATLLADAYGIVRRNYYYALADRNPRLRKFARRRDGGKGGWILRAEAYVSARFRLTDAAHAERVRAWG
ncbi:MAG: peptidoglycan-binding protein [Alphaproteobacteria bacterium]|nr:MAG: peptidoglycan-binding protein [Alphaproteobacteria bacterium]